MVEAPNKNAPTQKGQSALLSVGADSIVHTIVHPTAQALPPMPRPYVAFYPGPDGQTDRFLIQGMIDREHIGFAAQALVDLLDAIDGDPDEENFDHDLEDDDPDSSVDDQPCDPDSDDDNILPIPGGGSGI